MKVSDWPSWSATIQGICENIHLLGRINGIRSPPILPSDADATTRQKYDIAKETLSKRDDHDAYYIISLVDPSLHAHLCKFESAAVM